MTDGFQFGNAKVNEAGFNCCGKPRGCTMTHEGCAYLRHPWKRAMVFGDPTAPCQMTWFVDGSRTSCTLRHEHEGPCVPAA